MNHQPPVASTFCACVDRLPVPQKSFANRFPTLTLSELESPAPGILSDSSIELDKIAVVLEARADLAEGYTIDLGQLAIALNVTEQAAFEAIAATTRQGDSDDDAGGTPLLDLAAHGDLIHIESPKTIRDVMMEQLADLEVLTAAIGGDRLTVTRTRREKYRGGRGDDEYRNVTENIPIVDAGAATMFQFVQVRMGQDRTRRKATNDLLKATENIDRSDLTTAAADVGITEQELQAVLGAADLLTITGRQGGESNGITAATGGAAGDFPDRGDYPDGERGDRDGAV